MGFGGLGLGVWGLRLGLCTDGGKGCRKEWLSCVSSLLSALLVLHIEGGVYARTLSPEASNPKPKTLSHGLGFRV